MKALQYKKNPQDGLLLQMTVAVTAERRRWRWWQRGGGEVAIWPRVAPHAPRNLMSSETGETFKFATARVPVSNVVL